MLPVVTATREYFIDPTETSPAPRLQNQIPDQMYHASHKGIAPEQADLGAAFAFAGHRSPPNLMTDHPQNVIPLVPGFPAAFSPAPGFKLRRGVVCRHQCYSPLPVDYCPCCTAQRSADAMQALRQKAAEDSKLKKTA